VRKVEVAGVQLLWDVSAGVLRPLVPVQQRRAVFEALHSLSHPGIRATRRIVTARTRGPGRATASVWARAQLHTNDDRTSRWPEAVPLSTITAEACADSFVSGWIARFGVPAVVTTDRGTQFSSAT
jgi:hypothetical protein